MVSETRQVLLLLADISGYSKFMLAHEKALRHSQTIIASLLESLIAQVGHPVEVAEVQGDALFMYVTKHGADSTWEEQSAQVTASLLRLFDAFTRRREEIGAYSICRCDACANLGKLSLKVIAHSGEALFNRVGTFAVLSGVDVIRLHRLAKNSVKAGEYLLMTESAFRDLDLPAADTEPGREEYADIGAITTRVYLPEVAGGFDPATLDTSSEAATLGISILRDEIRREYTDVAREPGRGYHFNTGPAAAHALGYEPAWLDGVPEAALESFAGTGNPFRAGDIDVGDRVVDVGSGSGLDSLIAGRRVGSGGRVIGVDMTEAMLEKARSAATAAGLEHVEFRHGFAEELPVPDGWADVVVSNGVLNLAPDKSRVLAELNRVLRPGGRLLIGDILVERAVPEEAKGNLDLWTN